MSALPESTEVVAPRSVALGAKPVVCFGFVAFVLGAFFALLLLSVSRMGLTTDEPGHAAAGTSFWRYHDYRLDPENGNLPQRLIGLPFWLSATPFPGRDTPEWTTANPWGMADRWFFDQGNDAAALTQKGRAAIAVVSVALGLLVWAWSRRLFGLGGAVVSLLVFVLDPTVLAHGALMTSDMTTALFFLVAVGCVWRVLHRVSVGRVVACGFATGALFLSKMSAPLILPMALLLVVVRLVNGQPLPLQFGANALVVSRGKMVIVFLAASVATALLAWSLVWASFGFRYSITPADSAPADLLAATNDTPAAEPTGKIGQCFAVARHYRILPEAYLQGAEAVWKNTRGRVSFFRGEVRTNGWAGYFPYTFLTKTPLGTLAIFALGAGMVFVGWSRRTRSDAATRSLHYQTAPLWILLVVYAAAALSSSLNIGHRHLLTLYPPLFILAGASVHARGARGRWVAVGLLALVAADTVRFFPNYLAYFNPMAGGPETAYRRLADSSLDWGQNLPAVRTYLERASISTPVYLSYSGMDSQAYYGISARPLYSYGGQQAAGPLLGLSFPSREAAASEQQFLNRHPHYSVLARWTVSADVQGVLLARNADAFRLAGGLYLISAGMLQPIGYDPDGPVGPWNARYEADYQKLRPAAEAFFNGNQDARRAALAAKSPAVWATELQRFDALRFARLTAWLRGREPDEKIGCVMLVYRLTDADLALALDGAPTYR